MLSKKTEKFFMEYICSCYSKPNTKYVDPYHFRGHTSFSNDEIEEILRKMEASGYISYQKFEEQPRPFIKIEPKGRIYFETLRDEKNKFIKGHIITPITVSVLTTILTSIALNWLPVLLEWILQLIQ